MITLTLNRYLDLDPLIAAWGANAQALAERTARQLFVGESDDGENDRKFLYRFERTIHDGQPCVSFIAEGTDIGRMTAFSLALGDLGVEVPLTWTSQAGEGPPHLVQITNTEDGTPAHPLRAADVMQYFSLVGPLENGEAEGRYRTVLPVDFGDEGVAFLAESDWLVEVVEGPS